MQYYRVPYFRSPQFPTRRTSLRRSVLAQQPSVMTPAKCEVRSIIRFLHFKGTFILPLKFIGNWYLYTAQTLWTLKTSRSGARNFRRTEQTSTMNRTEGVYQFPTRCWSCGSACPRRSVLTVGEIYKWFQMFLKPLLIRF